MNTSQDPNDLPSQPKTRQELILGHSLNLPAKTLKPNRSFHPLNPALSPSPPPTTRALNVTKLHILEHIYFTLFILLFSFLPTAGPSPFCIPSFLVFYGIFCLYYPRFLYSSYYYLCRLLSPLYPLLPLPITHLLSAVPEFVILCCKPTFHERKNIRKQYFKTLRNTRSIHLPTPKGRLSRFISLVCTGLFNCSISILENTDYGHVPFKGERWNPP